MSQDNNTSLLARVQSFIKDWTLPLSMTVGVVSYFAFVHIDALQPVKGPLVAFIPYLLPMLLFAMLFLTYVKIDLRQLRPRRYHVWLVLIQLVATCAIAAFLVLGDVQGDNRALGEAMMACTIAPMAAVGAVVTTKIGGNAATATTYTLISSMVAAVAIPAIYPLVESSGGYTFLELFWQILCRVFPTIVFPLFVTIIIRWISPAAHGYCVRVARDKAFYMWAICTAVNTAQILRILFQGTTSGVQEIIIVIAAGVLCVVQFAVGRLVGRAHGDTIAGGQSLGQKNTVLSIWIAMTFLHPAAALAPGAYLLWQNLINSLQIYRHNKE